MSSREPLWYCHECHAEMRPLMVPDPQCTSCNGSFVERIENPADDPREFQHADAGQWGDEPLPPEMDVFLAGLRSILNPVPLSATPPSSTGNTSGAEGRRASGETPRSPTEPSVNTPGRNSPFTFRIEQSSSPGGRTRTFVFGAQSGSGSNDQVPRLSQLSPPRNADGTQQDRISGPLLAQYLLSLMGPGRGSDPFTDLLGPMFGSGGLPGGGADSGRWGDYVFNQEALDQIISQIMENSNANQPVPATEEVMEKLPRVVLEQGSPLLEKDCAVCKDQFTLETEDPGEQIVITLPCQHPFHEPCILPWLKSSGTCPVCRYQLVPQPSAQSPGPRPPQAGSSTSNNSSSTGSASGGGLLHNVLNLFGGHGAPGSSPGASGSSSNNNNNPNDQGDIPSRSGQPSSRRNQNYDFPGGWADQVD